MPYRDLPTIRPPRSILVAVHLAERDDSVPLATAAAYASALDAELILVGVAPVALPVTSDGGLAPGTPTALPPRDQELIDELVRERLEEAARALPHGVAARSVMAWGDLGTALVDTAEREGADLVVVPMRSGGPLAHLLHDGDDRYVLHHSVVPVVVVPVAGSST